MRCSSIVDLPPVALAIRFKSAFLQRRTAIAPASTNCFKQRSSIPPVVKITLAPALSNLATRSFAISVSLEKRKKEIHFQEKQNVLTVFELLQVFPDLQQQFEHLISFELFVN